MGRLMAIYWPFNGHFHMQLGACSSRQDVQGICASGIYGIWYRWQLPRSDRRRAQRKSVSQLVRRTRRYHVSLPWVRAAAQGPALRSRARRAAFHRDEGERR